MKKLVSICLLMAILCAIFSGCHGAKERVAFEVPEEFDTTQTHELTFWAKNDTNMTQVNN